MTFCLHHSKLQTHPMCAAARHSTTTWRYSTAGSCICKTAVVHTAIRQLMTQLGIGSGDAVSRCPWLRPAAQDCQWHLRQCVLHTQGRSAQRRHTCVHAAQRRVARRCAPHLPGVHHFAAAETFLGAAIMRLQDSGLLMHMPSALSKKLACMPATLSLVSNSVCGCFVADHRCPAQCYVLLCNAMYVGTAFLVAQDLGAQAAGQTSNEEYQTASRNDYIATPPGGQNIRLLCKTAFDYLRSHTHKTHRIVCLCHLPLSPPTRPDLCREAAMGELPR